MKTLNKITKFGALVVGLTFATSTFASTTAIISPTVVSVTPGQTFTLTVSVNPTVANYAETVELKFPADMLQVVSFTQASNWMSLTQSGYDNTDNVNGSLLKSAGYPNGITSTTVFGTVTFSAKKAGTAQISIGSNSQAFDSGSQSTITGTGASVTITSASAPVVTPKTTTPAPVKTVAPVVTTTTAQPTAVVTSPTSTPDATNQVAAVATASTGFPWVWVGVLIVLVIAGVYYFVLKSKKPTTKKFK